MYFWFDTQRIPCFYGAQTVLLYSIEPDTRAFYGAQTVLLYSIEPATRAFYGAQTVLLY